MPWKHFPFYCHMWRIIVTSHEPRGVSNHRQLHCMCNRLSRKTSMKYSKTHITGPLWTESTSDLCILHNGSLQRKPSPCYDVIVHLFVWYRDTHDQWVENEIIIYLSKKVVTDRPTGTQLSLLFGHRFNFSYENKTVLSESVWDN